MKTTRVNDNDLRLVVSHCIDHPDIQKWPVEKLYGCFKLLSEKFEKQNKVKVEIHSAKGEVQ